MPNLKQCIRRAVAGKVGFLNWLLWRPREAKD